MRVAVTRGIAVCLAIATVAALTAVAALATPDAASTPAAGPPATSECTLKGARGYGTVQAQCGVLVRPENPLAADGATVELAFARIPALSPRPQADAFTVINGGPGGSSLEMYADLASAFQGILRERDIIVLDQRGTGRSNALGCPQIDENASTEFVETEVAEATRTCLANLPGDPRGYTTSAAVEDLEALREALGYKQLDVYGVSYGSRVALHYLKRYPDTTRTVIIDGVLPPGHALGTEVATNSQHTLDTILQRCAADADCAGAFPDLAAEFDTVARNLSEAPVLLEVPDPVTTEPQAFEFTYSHFALAMRLLFYAPENAALVPLMIHQAALGNYLPAATHAVRVIRNLTNAISNGMHNAVVCTEDAPFYAPESLDWAALRATYLGEDQLRTLITMCREWPAGYMHDDLRAEPQSSVPVLILSGEYDPITPPAYGAQVHAALDNSLHVVAPGQGHGVIGRGCLPRIASDFVDDADLAALDTQCVNKLGAEAFFVNLMGPPP
jgi:pimeloyl-ACP methyl ester carboxylesterase